MQLKQAIGSLALTGLLMIGPAFGALADESHHPAERATEHNRGDMKGPGMMGQGRMAPGMGQGMMGPGMMGPGMMGQGNMGPGMMGQGMIGPGMMDPGMMGHGMMHGGVGHWRGDRSFSADEIRRVLDGQIALRGLQRLKVGAIEAADDSTYTVDIVTSDDSLALRLTVDKATGRILSME